MILYEYDHEGHLIKRQLTDSDGEEGEKHLWIYENKLLMREESYNEYGDLESSKTYTYSENGSLEEVVEVTYSVGEQTRYNIQRSGQDKGLPISVTTAADV